MVACIKAPSDKIDTAGTVPGPLKVTNDLSQCPAIDGKFEVENEDGTRTTKEIKLDRQNATPILVDDSAKYTVDGSNHKGEDMESYQAGCTNGAVLVQSSISFTAISTTEYRWKEDELVITRKSLKDYVKIVGPEQTVWKRK
jgi:hypothetical protein